MSVVKIAYSISGILFDLYCIFEDGFNGSGKSLEKFYPERIGQWDL
jgi:hypothetical protein